MFKTLKQRNFFLIITGKLISLMGDAIYEIAVIWYVLSNFGSGSGTMIALIMLMAIAPKVIFGSIAGSIVDRYNKKRIMITADTIAAFTVFIVFVLLKYDRLGSVAILLSIAILSVCATTVRIAVNSMIPEMFTDKELYDANGLNQFVERGTSLLGYAVGGGVIALIGFEGAVLLNIVSFVLCVILESFLKLGQKKAIEPAAMDSSTKAGFKKDFLEAWNYLQKNLTLLRIVLVFTVTNFLLDPLLNIVMPFALKNNFGATAFDLGLVMASLPLGFCVGAIYFSKKPDFLMGCFVLFKSILFINLTLVALSLIFLTPQLFARKEFIIIYMMLCLFLSGIFSSAINISVSVHFQKKVPEHIIGKFIGFTSSISAGLVPMGSLIVGALISIVAPSWIYIFSIAAIFMLIMLVPKRSYSFE